MTHRYTNRHGFHSTKAAAAVLVVLLAALIAAAFSQTASASGGAAGSAAAWGNNYDGVNNVPALNEGFVSMAAGFSHGLGLRTDGTVAAWGRGASLPSPNSDFVAIAAGSHHSLGLKSDGSVSAWGSNSRGQCNVPEPNSGFVAVSAGWEHSVGIKADGSIVAWGNNDYGQCTPPVSNSGFIALASGYFHNVALKANGSIAAWGHNSYGQCNPPDPNSGFSGVAAGSYHSLGLKADGSARAWGINSYGQCNVPGPNSGFVMLAACIRTSFGLKADGSIVAWGSSESGLCEVPAPNSGFIGVFAGPWNCMAIRNHVLATAWGLNNDNQCTIIPNGGLKAVSAGYFHSAGLKEDGTAASWGDNTYGQLALPSPNSGISSIACGWYHTLFLRSDGSVAATGLNDSSQCTVPDPNSGFVAVAAGGYHSLGLKSDGSIAAWGDILRGQCDVPEPNSDFIAVAAGMRFSLGLKSNGTIVGWGENFDAELNVPDTNSDFISIAAGGVSSVGLKSNGSVVCWGSNAHGQTDPPSPNSGITQVSSCNFTNRAVRSDGTTVGWGDDTWGQAGPPTANARVASAVVGHGHSIALQWEPAPIVTGISPGQGNRDDVLSGAQIYGSNFRGPASNITAQLKKGASTINGTVTNVTSTQVTADFTISSDAEYGLWDVYIEHNDDHAGGTLAGGFLVPGPQITVTGIDPESGYRGNYLTGVHITGTEFRGPVGNVTVQLKQGTEIKTCSVTEVTPAQITVEFYINPNQPTGDWAVYVEQNDDHKNATLPAAFHVDAYPAPVIAGITPDFASRGDTPTGVLITGSNFRGPTENIYVYLINVDGDYWQYGYVTDVTPTQLTVDFDTFYGDAPLGAWDVYVVQADDLQEYTLAGAFQLRDYRPVVTGIDPARGRRGDTLTGVAIAGSSFRGPVGNVTAQLKNGADTITGTVTNVTDTQVTADFTIPTDAQVDTWDVYIKHNDDTNSGTLPAAFTVDCAMPVINTAAVSNVTPTTASSGGNVTDDGGDPETVRGVCWSTIENPTIADDYTEDGTGAGSFTSSITDLSPGTLYHVRAYATNSAGTSYGDDLTFTTDTTPTVTTTAPSNIGSTTADSGGNVTSDGEDPVTARGVCWSTSPDPTIAASKTEDGTGTGVFTSSITGLSPNTTYHVRAYATNSVGTSYGSDIAFTTLNPAEPTAWYLAEGSNAWGFNTYITIENPQNETLTARLTYMDPNPQSGSGVVGTRDVTLPPLSQTTVSSQPDIGPVDFSTKVKCLEGKQIAVDRTMFWTGDGAPSPEGHSSIGTTTSSKTWYLPEGSSAWGFETWTLLLNPNDSDAHVKLTYMTENGTPEVFDRTVPARSRATYSMAADIGAADASTEVSSDLPVVAERSMYRNSRREGSCSIGATTPAADYFLAEGATGYDVDFTTWVLVQNPNDSDVQVTLTYQTQSGPEPQAPFTMGANSRRTVRVNDALPPNTDVSTTVHGSKPVIAERAMYWGAGTALGEAMHASVGLDSAHMSFYLPDGQTSDGHETWTLVANPNPGAVTVRITYLPQGGGTPVSFTDEIPPGTRTTYNMADKIPSGRASIMVQSLDGARPVIVERAMYWNSRGAGTDTIGGFSD